MCVHVCVRACACGVEGAYFTLEGKIGYGVDAASLFVEEVI